MSDMATYRELLEKARSEIAEIDARAAQDLEGAAWIDVREADEWQEGHIPGARHVPRGSLESRIESAVPDKSERLEVLATRYPNDPVVQFNYGSALFCRGYGADAVQAYEAAKRSGRDTQYEITADNLLHPQFFAGGYPIFEPTGHDPLLIRGSLLQREGHQHSAERLYRRAARLHPNDPEALVAAAVGRFDESNLSASFSRLGPLARRFPSSQTVRYHLGLLLVWIGEAKQGIAEFELAQKLGPRTTLGREAARLLARISARGTPGSGR